MAKSNNNTTKKSTAKQAAKQVKAPSGQAKGARQSKADKEAAAAEKAKSFALKSEMAAVAIMGLSLVIFICVLASDKMGFVGGYISAFMKHLTGVGALAIPIAFAFFGYRLFRHKYSNIGRSALIFVGFLVTLISIAHVLTYKNAAVLSFASYVSESYLNGGLNNGGLIGALVGGALSKLIGTVGAYIVLVVILVILFIMATGKSISALFEFIGDTIDGIKEDVNEYTDSYEENTPATQKPNKTQGTEQVTIEQYEKDREQLNLEQAKQAAKNPETQGMVYNSKNAENAVRVYGGTRQGQAAPAAKKGLLQRIFGSEEPEPKPFDPGFPVDIRMGDEKPSEDEMITIEHYIVNENNRMMQRTLKVPDYLPHLSDKVEAAKKALYEPNIVFTEIGGEDEASADGLNDEIPINGISAEQADTRQSAANADAPQNSDTPPWDEPKEQAQGKVNEDEAAKELLHEINNQESKTEEQTYDSDSLAASTQREAKAANTAKVDNASSAQPPIHKPAAATQNEYKQGEEPLIIEAEENKLVNKLSTEKIKTEYRFPKLEFLAKSKGGSGIDRKEMYEKAKKLENTLSIFGIDAKVNNISQGPAVTRYELTPPEGVKVSRIESLENDIMLALAANSIRMEVPIPGKSAIGIEIPNDSIKAVYFSEILMSEKFNNFKSKLAFGLGKDITGNVIVRDIAKMPHLLIAGATGSGKSVCVNTMLTSILYKATPDEVKLILIDPKVVELSVYNGIPHLLIPVVTDPHKAAGALNWAVREMMRRYDLFASTGTRKLEGYNEKVENDEKLPQILVVIDELADLMIAAKKEVESSIQRLTQLARAAGIHLIIATQRPSVDVITGVIKANVPSRIAFKVSSSTDSRTILDTSGADKLLGKGDMLLKTVDMDKPLRIQGAFVSDEEVEKIVNYIKVDESHYDTQIINALEHSSDDEASGGSSSSNSGDESLINDVISFVVHSKKASISSIQRKFRIGYNRAANIMDELEERGIVGEDNGGTKGRAVLMDKYEFSEWQQRRNM